MNNIISPVCLPNSHRYHILGDQAVEVEVFENPYDFDLNSLFSMAARKNKKRGFLFVSEILGKHIPIDPFVGLLGGIMLGVCFEEQVYGFSCPQTEPILKALKGEYSPKMIYEDVCHQPLVLPEQTLFIGFAETATALGHSMSTLFKNASFVHTSREYIPELTSVLDFNEEHSHAVAHRCYLLNEALLSEAKLVVLVDDEITTGKTALNIITEIQAKFPKREYVVASLLDWRSDEDLQEYKALERRLNVKIHTVSLIKGKVTAIGEPLNEDQLGLQQGLRDYKRKIPYESINLQIKETINVTSEDSLGYKNTTPYLRQSGRFGIEDKENGPTYQMCKEIGLQLGLDRKGKRTVCLGTGEFMFIPMLISAYMGEGIRYQSTTRSPVYPHNEANYAIKTGIIFASIDDPKVNNYVYNVPANYYDEAYIFIERGMIEDRLTAMLFSFENLNIPRMVLVFCNG